MKTMAEVLAEHYEYNWEPDAESWECQCGHLLGEDVFRRDADPNHRAHQAAALSAAGFGPVQEARAEALAEVAEDALEGLRACCPNETLAIGFMSGYAEAARDHADSEAAP